MYLPLQIEDKGVVCTTFLYLSSHHPFHFNVLLEALPAAMRTLHLALDAQQPLRNPSQIQWARMNIELEIEWKKGREKESKEKRRRGVWGKINGLTFYMTGGGGQLGGDAYISLKCLLSGCEVREEKASSWPGFSSRSKIDSCIHWRKRRAFMRSMQSISSASASAASLSLLLWEINHSSLVARERCFLLHRPYSPFRSDSAKLFAFVGHVCQPFSHLSPPVRFTARQGQVWPVNLWWLKCLPVVSWKEHVVHQMFMERLNIVLFISRERGGEGLGCVVVLFDKLKEVSAGQETTFPTLSL